MSVKDADNINKSFVKLNDSIKIYKKSIKDIEAKFLQYEKAHIDERKRFLAERDSILSLKSANIQMVKTMQAEFMNERKNQIFFTAIVLAIASIFAMK